MPETVKNRLATFLRSSERYTGTGIGPLLRHGFWINLNYIVTSIFAFLLSIAFANLLSKQEYGTYQYVLSLASLLSAFTFTGFSTAITQSVARGYGGTLRASIRPQLLWNLIPAAAALIWAGYYLTLGNTILAFGLLCVGITLPLLNTFNSYASYLGGTQQFRMQSLYAIASNTAYYVCMFAALFIAPEAIVIVFVNLAVTTITTIISYVRVTATYHPTGENDPAAPRFARHLTIMSVLGLLASQADNLLVFHFLGAATLAIYSITSLLPEKIGGMFKFIATVALPRFTSRTFAEIQASLSKRLIALTILILGIAGLYALIAPTLFRFIYPAYAPNVGYSMLYSLTMLNIVGIFAASALSAHRKIRELYILNVAVPIIQILLQAVAVVVGGLWWLVVAKIVSVFIYSALCVFFVRYAPSNAIQE